MAASALSIAGCMPSIRLQSFLTPVSAIALQWHLTGGQQQQSRLLTNKKRGQEFCVLAKSNDSSTDGNSNKGIVMVDALEAKKLAAKQMEEIKAKERLKKRRQIEAINGAWAIIGLTAGLVIEGHTGKSILAQVVDFLRAIARFVVR